MTFLAAPVSSGAELLLRVIPCREGRFVSTSGVKGTADETGQKVSLRPETHRRGECTVTGNPSQTLPWHVRLAAPLEDRLHGVDEGQTAGPPKPCGAEMGEAVDQEKLCVAGGLLER